MKIKDLNRLPDHITSIGGQAVIEGVMMRGPKDLSVAIRKPDGEIELKSEKLNTLAMRHKIFRLPFLRGVVSLGESLIIGTRILMYSAEFYEEPGEENQEAGIFDRLFKEKSEDVQIFLTVVSAFLLALVFFMLLPTFITNFFKKYISTNLGLNLLEGGIRILFFFIYLVNISKMEDIKRVFQYHGAEHKSIHCYEAGLDLTVENARKQPALHPRCGTSFLFMVMLVSVLVLSLFGWPNPLLRLLIRLLMFPVIAGISYEINKLIGKSSSKLAYILSYPGLMIQDFATIKEPDDDQLEVALLALRAVVTGNKEDDKW